MSFHCYDFIIIFNLLPLSLGLSRSMSIKLLKLLLHKNNLKKKKSYDEVKENFYVNFESDLIRCQSHKYWSGIFSFQLTVTRNNHSLEWCISRHHKIINRRFKHAKKRLASLFVCKFCTKSVFTTKIFACGVTFEKVFRLFSQEMTMTLIKSSEEETSPINLHFFASPTRWLSKTVFLWHEQLQMSLELLEAKCLLLKFQCASLRVSISNQ